MKSKLEWPFNLMADVNKKITDENRKLPECAEDAPEDIMAVVSYIFTDIAGRGLSRSKTRGAYSVVSRYRDNVTMKELAEGFGVTRNMVDVYIDKVMTMLAGYKRYHDLLKYGLTEYLRIVDHNALKRGRDLGYREGVLDTEVKSEQATFVRGYTKGYNDGICGLNNRINEITNDTPIENCDFSIRAYNCLKRAGVNTVSQLVALSEDELYNIRNLGRKTLDEILAFITKYRDVTNKEAEVETDQEKVEEVAQKIVAAVEEKVHEDKAKLVTTSKAAACYTPEELAEMKAKTHENAKRLYEAEKKALGLK